MGEERNSIYIHHGWIIVDIGEIKTGKAGQEITIVYKRRQNYVKHPRDIVSQWKREDLQTGHVERAFAVYSNIPDGACKEGIGNRNRKRATEAKEKHKAFAGKTRTFPSGRVRRCSPTGVPEDTKKRAIDAPRLTNPMQV
ncbi:hypothetical protein KQX54_007401 [Cotesia glomerata]|uniref:Uncharacterized protein n=1 Tax=Cotesia glomerata TaxID=32391 RepID=A0AAV7J2W0_COTGL|nr:hypothetical protein KQX54_007401 [Cotesia glomerata]